MGNGEKFTEEFFKMAYEDPDFCLKLISDMVTSNENLLTDPMLRLCRAIAYGNKGASLYSNKNHYDDEMLDLFEKALIEYRKFFELTPEEMPPKSSLAKKIDAIGITLERLRPGKIQELLGFTKLKYLVYGGRVSINTGCEEELITTEDDQRFFGEMFFSFPHIIRSALVGSCGERDEEGRRFMYVGLFEDEEMNTDLIGDIYLFEDGSFKSTVHKNKK